MWIGCDSRCGVLPTDNSNGSRDNQAKDLPTANAATLQEVIQDRLSPCEIVLKKGKYSLGRTISTQCFEVRKPNAPRTNRINSQRSRDDAWKLNELRPPYNTWFHNFTSRVSETELTLSSTRNRTWEPNKFFKGQRRESDALEEANLTTLWAFIGASDSTQSSLISRFTNATPNGDKSVRKGYQVGGRPCTLELHDIPLVNTTVTPTAQETIKTVDAIVFVFNINSSRSLFYLPEYKDFASKMSSKAPIYLIGLTAEGGDKNPRALTKEKAQKQAASWGWGYREIFLSRSSTDVEEFFIEVVETVRTKNAKTNRLSNVGGRLMSKMGGKNKDKLKRTDSLKKGLAFLSLENEQPREDKEEWDTKPLPVREWSEIEPTSMDGEQIDLQAKTRYGYSLELGRNNIKYNAPVDVELQHLNVPFFKRYLLSSEHYNYMRDVEILGPCVVSLGGYKSGKPTKGSDRLSIPPQHSTMKDQLKWLKSNYSKFKNSNNEKLNFNTKWVSISDPNLDSDLADMEQKEIVRRYKFGVIYQREGQDSEDQFFSNVETSPDYEEFLRFLGTMIELDGWTGYTGGLDTKKNTTGTHSLYTFHNGFEIMFHVSTLLPFQKDDLQRVERKRHIGNDVIVVVFQEGDKPFNPFVIKSQFNQVFMVVSVDSRDEQGNPRYRIGFANKSGIQPYGPFIPSPAIFNRDKEFRDYLLTKLINAERWAMFSPEFKLKFVTTKRGQLEAFFEKYARTEMSGGARQRKGSVFSPSGSRKNTNPERVLTAETASSTGSKALTDGSMTQEALLTIIDKVVGVGRNIYQQSLREYECFDASLFKEQLQQMVFLSVTNQFFQNNKPELITTSSDIVSHGKALSTLQIQRKENNSPETAAKVTELQENLRKTVLVFFTTLKEFREEWTSSESTGTTPVISRRSEVADLKHNAMSQSTPIISTTSLGMVPTMNQSTPSIHLSVPAPLPKSPSSNENPTSFHFPTATQAAYNGTNPIVQQSPVVQPVSTTPAPIYGTATQSSYGSTTPNVAYGVTSPPLPGNPLSYSSPAPLQPSQETDIQAFLNAWGNQADGFSHYKAFVQYQQHAPWKASIEEQVSQFKQWIVFQQKFQQNSPGIVLDTNLQSNIPRSGSVQYQQAPVVSVGGRLSLSTTPKMQPTTPSPLRNMESSSSLTSQAYDIRRMLQGVTTITLLEPFLYEQLSLILSSLVPVLRGLAQSLDSESSNHVVHLAKQLLQAGVMIKSTNEGSEEFYQLKDEISGHVNGITRFLTDIGL
ncbi:hypothetical protein PROFUN_12807 [Planoprotostelium fungivorum]|uniref:Rap-GAP domain-containing protein n=1 Tax=Planoprotostelium fungivorum TaxID=1890364 RepID=A0A2P6N6Q4_9EUKA|nr:hypothetical protein PROFUN_12807 [Planoprotostelium fungivorum]